MWCIYDSMALLLLIITTNNYNNNCYGLIIYRYKQTIYTKTLSKVLQEKFTQEETEVKAQEG